MVYCGVAYVEEDAMRFGAEAGAIALAITLAAGVAVAAEVAEVEPNAGLNDATSLPAGDAGAGAVSPIGDHDFWRVDGAQAGDEIFALVETAQSTSGNTNALLVSFDTNGAPIEDDDNDGPGQAPALGGDAVPSAGSVYYEVFDFNEDGLITPYRLFQLIADPTASVAETEPNNNAFEANAVTGGSLASGTVVGSDFDLFAIQLAVGEALAAVLDRDPDDNGAALGSLIDIVDTDGVTALATGDAISGDVHGVGPITAAEAGTYFVQVHRTMSGTDDDYRVAFMTVVPEPDVFAAALAAIGMLCAGRRRCRT
jgi:hypothetical protein